MLQYEIKETTQFIDYLDKNELQLVEMENEGKQINNMQCWEIKGKIKDALGDVWDIMILQSYYTLVAFIDLEGKDLYIIDKFSRTTSKQITIWSRKYL